MLVELANSGGGKIRREDKRKEERRKEMKEESEILFCLYFVSIWQGTRIAVLTSLGGSAG
jgi:hypothetical protein